MTNLQSYHGDCSAT